MSYGITSTFFRDFDQEVRIEHRHNELKASMVGADSSHVLGSLVEICDAPSDSSMSVFSRTG